jgi:hypothetical protein
MPGIGATDSADLARLPDVAPNLSTDRRTPASIQPGGTMRASLRRRSIVASRRGTTASIPARNGPNDPDVSSRGSGRLNDGRMTTGSSPARKVDDASARDVDRSERQYHCITFHILITQYMFLSPQYVSVYNTSPLSSPLAVSLFVCFASFRFSHTSPSFTLPPYPLSCRLH